MKQTEANTICSILYTIRDSVNENNMHVALMLTRDLHDHLAEMIKNNRLKDCDLNCEVKYDKENV